MALEGTIVLMPVPVKPPQIPTTSRVGRSHLRVLNRVNGATFEDERSWPSANAVGVNKRSQDRVKLH